MCAALELAQRARAYSSPNPWVGCRLVAADGRVFEGSTAPPGGPHAEVVALRNAGAAARGATAYVTLEPCAHHGRTPPCTDALIAARARRVVVGILDPDPRVNGRGLSALRAAGVEVELGVGARAVKAQLAPYLTQRRTGRPLVVLKLAASLDGRIAAPDGTSAWITGEAARADAHRLRAESDAVLVGAGTVRADDPLLTVRDAPGPSPLRVVLGPVPPGAAVLPAVSMSGDLGTVLDQLGQRGVLQLLVEGGATVAGAFHRAGLVDRYVVYFAPALFGGDDGLAMFAGPGAPTMEGLWRGRIEAVTRLGSDLRLDLVPEPDDLGTGPGGPEPGGPEPGGPEPGGPGFICRGDM
ncbi:MAG: bifunctional diaminohydroxyphosphoribosylaminopyrimidine deaminase/5-amino-6-(5-phosphoribosylamino)uracil reductase RibD [Actinomycetota bacterium]|nr:bifunctional diaminohydroxyphosphoribosylaminopyrimidine deaminase/5-amino-6-(5-phosphoribosylamino)uracil reductase RibD [Actinomycetota bacterium]